MDNSNYKVKISTFTEKISVVYRSLSPEKVITFWALFGLGFCLFFAALIVFNQRFLIKVPVYGGAIREGIVGTPRFINPILASSEQDKDLSALHRTMGHLPGWMADTIHKIQDIKNG